VTMNRYHAVGTGPGAITPDGCPVELYALLRPHGEQLIIHDAVSAGATILELGAGTGRITHELLALGHQVVAVDESREMLGHIHGAHTIAARIEDLALPEQFDAVVLMSYLVNVPDAALRAAWLRTCHRHVAVDGCVILQRHTPAWFDQAKPSERTEDGVVFRLADVARPAPDLLSITMEYEHDGRRWRHSFTHCRMDDDQLRADLSRTGLLMDSVLTQDRAWIRAGRAGRPA
jgi:SAM-dependent methyltransferase